MANVAARTIIEHNATVTVIRFLPLYDILDRRGRVVNSRLAMFTINLFYANWHFGYACRSKITVNLC